MKKKPTAKKPTKAAKTETLARGYRDIISVGGKNGDWILQSLSEDADLWQNAYALTSRVRDLFKISPLYQKIRELAWVNTFGSNGVMLRMKVKETENRVVYAPDEKKALVAHEARINRVRKWASEKAGTTCQEYRAFKLADALEQRTVDCVLRGQAMIEVGASDVYANQLIERKRVEWQRKEFSDMRGTRNYFVQCLLRLISAIRDGDFFIRMIRNPKVNKFGFSLQMINAEWCDRFLNATLSNGNVIRMGIEYEMTAWGLGKVVAYYFITRAPQDWQYTTAGTFNFPQPAQIHQRVPAEEIIHYARPVDAESTRPAPWVASTIPKGRHLDQYELAEVIAAREAACKVGFLYSDILPEGGLADIKIDPSTGVPAANAAAPGDTVGLPFGVKFMANDPKHPTQNFDSFRKGMVRSIAAGVPGSDYNTLANDLENINFSAGRLGRLDTNEMSMLIQRFDIDTAERPIFEAWLEMALITGAVPLPLAKFDKFNQPMFQGRRWAQVDEVKAETASAMRIANNKSSWSIECDMDGKDFEDVVFDKAENLMLMDQLGIDSALTESKPPSIQPAEDVADGEPSSPPRAKKPAKGLNGNGAHEELELSRI